MEREKKRAEKREEPRHGPDGLTLQIALAVICLAIGGLLLFVPEIDVRTLCVASCVLLLLGGAASIAYFFISGGTRSLREYSFSLGVLLAVLGGCGFAQLDALAASFLTATGFLALVLGVFMIQSTVQLSALRSGLNILAFLFALVTLFGAVVTLTGFQPILLAAPVFPQAVLLAAGALSLVSLLMTALVLRQREKRPLEPDAPPEGSAPPAENAPALEDPAPPESAEAAPPEPAAPAAPQDEEPLP